MTNISLAGLMMKMAEVPTLIEEKIGSGLLKAAVQVQKTAVEKFGNYQPQIGEFNAWAVLSPATLLKKAEAGAMQDDPLIGHYPGKRSTAYPTTLRQSIAIHVDKHQMVAQVGTNNPLGEYHEFGTVNIPPRPFLRPALFQNEEYIKEQVKGAVVEVIRHL